MKNMKTINIKSIGLFTLLIFAITSCKDMNDNFIEYLEAGETIYTNKIDSITSYAGDNRVKLEGYITNAYNVSDIVTRWKQGNEKKELVTAYDKKETTDKLEIIIPNLDEGTYEFTVFSRNSEGNTSIVEKVFATAYGQTYKNSLEPRNISKITFGSAVTEINIEFNVGNEYQRNTEVKYITTAEEEKIVQLIVGDKELNFTDIDLEKPVYERTFYVPTLPKELANGDKVETTIDLFSSEWKEVAIPEIPSGFPLAKDNWSVDSFSSEEATGEGPNNGRVIFLYDGNLDTFWHSQWSGAYKVYPHYFIIDMGQKAELVAFEVARRNNQAFFPSKFTFEVSDDKENWQGQEFVGNQDINGMQKFTFDTPVTGRYFKFTGLEDAKHGNQKHMCVSEITVFGKYE